MNVRRMCVMFGLLAGCGANAPGSALIDVPPAEDLGGEMDSGAGDNDSGPTETDTGTDTHHDTGTDTHNDTGTTHTDATSSSDVSSAPDVITLVSTPGQIYCFATPSCSGAAPVCCDARIDGGYSDTCVANVAACPTGGDAYQCAQSADCPSGNVCCTGFGTSSHGTMFLKGSACAASCTGTLDTQLCVTDAGCPSGMHCVAQRVSSRNIGTCM